MNNVKLKSLKNANKIGSSFKPKLVKGVETFYFKEDERGRFYLMRNPKNLKYVKINESGYRVIQMLDGNTSLREIETEITQQDIKLNVYEFTKFLAKRGFIDNLRVQKERSEDNSVDVFTTIKYPLIKADSVFALRFYRIYRLALSKIFLAFYSVLCGMALTLFFGNFSVILEDAFSTLSLDTPITPFVMSFILFYVIDFMHEVAHAAVFYNYGAFPQKIGFAFHYLIPFFYTDVPDVRSFSPRKSILVLLAGPLSTLFFGSISVLLYFLEPAFKTAWAMLAVGSYTSVIFTLCPFIKTDGYYVLETLLKFPNLHTHALRNIKNSLRRLFNILSIEEYHNLRNSYSKFERKTLDIYCLLLPIGMTGMIYVGAFLGLVKAFPKILSGLSWIFISPTVAPTKAYLSLFIALFFAIQLSFGIIIVLWRLFKWKIKGQFT